MASLSSRKTFAKATSLCGAPFDPIGSPLGRLDRPVYKFTA